VEACRIECGDKLKAPQSDPHRRGQQAGEYCIATRDTQRMHSAQRESIERTLALGRWPANVTLDEAAAALVDEASGETGANQTGPNGIARRVYSNDRTVPITGQENRPFDYGDTGGASRFFYVAKADKADRGRGNNHPTVKSTALMRWLVRLACPEGGTVLDPFMGSGSTGKAAVAEACRFVGIEREANYFAIARERILPAVRDQREQLFPAAVPPEQVGDLFAETEATS
jgi:hypothetical protein